MVSSPPCPYPDIVFQSFRIYLSCSDKSCEWATVDFVVHNFMTGGYSYFFALLWEVMLYCNFSSFKEIFLKCLSFFLELKKPTSDFSQFYWVYFLFIWKRSRQKLVKTGRKKMVLLTGLRIMDLVVAGISLVIGLGIFVFIASILCSAAFLHNAKHVSWFISQVSTIHW